MENPSLSGSSQHTGSGWSVRMADSVIARHTPDAARWHYEHGLVWQAILQVWRKTKEERYFHFVKNTVDQFVTPQGEIQSYRVDELNLDQIKPGTLLFPLYAITGDERYRRAMEPLRHQLRRQPRTRANGFWHKHIYPFQMWLDGLYMAQPFYAQYACEFNEPAAFDDIVHHFVLVEEHTRDEQTGLLYHAWDESGQMPWADPQTGRSPHFWSRAMGWYGMALIDVLDYLPVDHAGHETLVAILNRWAPALERVQDTASGLWYQVLDQGSRSGNYLEASGSAMNVNVLAKGVRKGYLHKGWLEIARKGFAGLLQHLVKEDKQGLLNLEQVCGACGLGGTPYRDGSYEYYVTEKIVRNDYKGVGPFILAALEMEQAG